MKKILDKKYFCYYYLIAVVSLMFCVIYHKYIFDGFAYVFSISGDIGSDTINSYFPQYSFLSDLFHSNNFDIFSLQSGLGADLTFMFSFLCNPFDLLVGLFAKDTLYIGIILSTYLKVIVISVFSFSYFKNILKNKNSALISTLAWVFGSYIVVWGQHYNFCTQIMNFTVLIFLLNKWLSGNKKSLYALIPFMSFFMINSYYFFYISIVFSVFYIFFYKLLTKDKIKEIFIKIIIFCGVTLLSLGIAAIFIFPIVFSFINSQRSDGILSLENILSMFGFFDLNVYATNISRFIGPNVVGSGFGIPWSGSGNFYEAALLSSSVLSLFALSYSFIFAKFRKIGRIILLVSLVLLSVPIFTYLFTFTVTSQRWTFGLIFVCALAIGHFADFILQDNLVELRRVSLTGIILLVTIVISLFIYQHFNVINLDMKVLAIIMVISFIYFLIIFNAKFNGSRKLQLITGVLILELIVVNYPIVNNRGTQKVEELNALYEDGTEKAVEYLKKVDHSLYRISKNYYSVFLNDPLAQGYFGFSSYSSAHSKPAWSFVTTYVEDSNRFAHPNYINYFDERLMGDLGGKYILSKVELESYDLLEKIENIYIYKNKDYKPFGTLYATKYDYKDIEKLPLHFRLSALETGYYETNSDNKDSVLYSDNLRKEKINILDAECINGTVIENSSGLNIKSWNNDLQIIKYFEKPRNTELNKSDYASFEFNAEKDAIFNLYFDTGMDFNEAEKESFPVKSGFNQILVPLSSHQGFTRVRIDLVDNIQSLFVKDITFIEENKKSNLVSALENATFINSILKGDVKNSSKEDKILMVPITYSDNWTATLSGKKVEVININNGLIGIHVPNGEYSLRMQYKYKYFYVGLVVSIISLSIFGYYIYSENRKKLSSRKSF